MARRAHGVCRDDHLAVAQRRRLRAARRVLDHCRDGVARLGAGTLDQPRGTGFAGPRRSHLHARHDLIVDCRVTQATGTGERDAAKEMTADLAGAHQKTVGADKNYDTKGFVAEMRRIGVTPHVAQNTARSGGSAIDGRTTRHVGYAKSINARRGIEKVFGWIKAFGGLRQFKLRGTEKVGAVFGLHVIAYNLIRLGNLLKPELEAA